jgi:hypothetical protein
MKDNLSDQQKEYISKAYVIEPDKADGWFYIHLEGKPYEIGFQHGYLLADALKEGFRVNRFGVKWDTGEDLKFFADAAERMWMDTISDEYLDEMQGIADGATKAGFPVSLKEIIAWNGLEELTSYWWPLKLGQTKGPLITRNSGGRCSAFIATGEVTEHGKTVIAHETWCTYLAGASISVILDIEPENGHRFIMQGQVGHIDSATDFYITDAGIMCTETTIGGGFAGYDETKMPEFYRSRKATQYAESIDHWISIMGEQNSGGIANSWLLGTTYSNEIARFELGLKYSNVEKKTCGAFYGFNVATDPRIRNQECGNTGLYYDIRDSGARRVRWVKLIGNLDVVDPAQYKKDGEYYGKVNVKNAKKMLGDHYDVYLEQQKIEGFEDHPCGHTICSHLDLDPANPLNHADQPPFYPWGSTDGKVSDADLAANMQLWARRGHPCGTPFCADSFLKKHPQYNWLEGYLVDMPKVDWHLFKVDEQKDQ